jgi:large subunit ribosomal protein L5
MASLLKTQYTEEIRSKLKEEFSIANEMAVPKLKKVVVSMGLGEAKDDAGVLTKATANLTLITGQTPIVTKAKKSISAFKLIAGSPIGLKVTLRGDRMYSFLDKLLNIVLPRVRDFRGVSDKSFDREGNYNLGLREQSIFPEIDYKNIDKARGMQITINMSVKDKEQGRRFLELLGMPFTKVA